MPAPFDKNFLKRFLNDECSVRESAEFQNWLAGLNHRDSDEWMRMIWDEGQSVDREFLGAEDRIYQKILSKLNYKNGPRQKAIKSTHPHTGPSQNFYKIKVIQVAAAVILFLVTIAAVRYFAPDKPAISSPQMTTLTYKEALTASGQKRTIWLPDGTKVILNSNSSLEYPQAFPDTARSVVLHGEAYFEVARNPYAPFSVHSGNLVTVALGTSFNIRCNDNDGDQYVSLTSGKVLVYDSLAETGHFGVLLKPGEELAYHAKDRTHDTRLFDYQEKIAWKDGVLYFGDDDLDSIVKKIEQWYGVTVHLANRPGNHWFFTGEFKDQSLENVLKGMAYSKDFKYSIRGKNVFMKFKTK